MKNKPQRLIKLEIDTIKKNLQERISRIEANLDPDSFHTWKENPLTKILFDDLQLLMLDRMIDISNNQPYTEQQVMKQAMNRGYILCLSDMFEWNPLPEDEKES